VGPFWLDGAIAAPPLRFQHLKSLLRQAAPGTSEGFWEEMATRSFSSSMVSFCMDIMVGLAAHKVKRSLLI